MIFFFVPERNQQPRNTVLLLLAAPAKRASGRDILSNLLFSSPSARIRMVQDYKEATTDHAAFSVHSFKKPKMMKQPTIEAHEMLKSLSRVLSWRWRYEQHSFAKLTYYFCWWWLWHSFLRRSNRYIVYTTPEYVASRTRQAPELGWRRVMHREWHVSYINVPKSRLPYK